MALTTEILIAAACSFKEGTGGAARAAALVSKMNGSAAALLAMLCRAETAAGMGGTATMSNMNGSPAALPELLAQLVRVPSVVAMRVVVSDTAETETETETRKTQDSDWDSFSSWDWNALSQITDGPADPPTDRRRTFWSWQGGRFPLHLAPFTTLSTGRGTLNAGCERERERGRIPTAGSCIPDP